MAIKETAQYQDLVEALAALKDLSIPENLQKTALEHLLGGTTARAEARSAIPIPLLAAPLKMTTEPTLRDFIGHLKPKGAVAEIPTLVYWAKEHENKEVLDERGIIELYRRAGLRPPKDVKQSLRDLCSKKYGRLEASGNGQVRLSRVGEDFVIHDVIGKIEQEISGVTK